MCCNYITNNSCRKAHMWHKVSQMEQNSQVRLFHVWVNMFLLHPAAVECVVWTRVITLDRTHGPSTNVQKCWPQVSSITAGSHMKTTQKGGSWRISFHRRVYFWCSGIMAVKAITMRLCFCQENKRMCCHSSGLDYPRLLLPRNTLDHWVYIPAVSEL